MDVFVAFLVTMVAAGLAGGVVYRFHKVFSERLGSGLNRAAADRAFAVAVCAYIIVLGSLSILRHVSLHSAGFDVGVFDQAIWNSLRGRPLVLSIIPDTPNLLGQRFSPILLALVPLYAVWTDPMVLLVVQTVALGASAFPIYWFARQQLGHSLALVVGIAYLVFPALAYVNLHEFHEVALVALFFSLATLFLLRRHDAGLLACLALALLSKEEIAFDLVAFGLFILLFQRRRKLGLALMLGGLGWAFLVLEYVIPVLRGSQFGGYYYFGGGALLGRGRYDYLGNSLSEIASTIFTRPDVVFAHLLIPDKLSYVLHLFVPVAFLPFVGIEAMLLLAPTIGFSLLSSFPFQFSIESHYAAPLIPLLFYGTIIGLRRLIHWSRRHAQGIPKLVRGDTLAIRAGLTGMLVVSVGMSYFLQSPGPLSLRFDPANYAITERVSAAFRFMQRVPAEGVLFAERELAAHLAERKQIYEIPYVLDPGQADYLLADTNSPFHHIFRDWWANALTTGYFEVTEQRDGFILYRRRPPDQPLSISFGDEMTLLGYSPNLTETLRGGRVFHPIVEWRADRPIGDRYLVSVQLVDRRGHVWAQQDGEPQNGVGRTDRWEMGRALGDQYSLKLPPTMPPGEYQLAIGVHTKELEYLPARDGAGKLLGEQPVLATVRVEKDHTSVTASQLPIEQPLFVDMGEMRFLGYVPPRQTIRPGELLQVGLYWRAREKPRGDYSIAVQLRDAAGSVAFIHSARPANDMYPTSQWEAGEVLLDWHDFNLPQGTAPGEYQIYVVLQDADGKRELGETKISDLAVVGQ